MGVACLLTSLEQGRTFVSYPLHRKPPSGDANYRLIKACRKRFLHYYWYGATSKSRNYREEVNNPLEPSCGLAPIQPSDVRQIRTGGRVIDRLKLR